MKTITIDSSTVWKSLPWPQIKERVFILQQKLYDYSKECDQKELERLQNYILNSSDSKIFAIQRVVDYISEYYLKYNQEKYSFNDEDKFLIYESLFENNISCMKIQFIIEQIKQYLVYLCLKPEWEARFEPIYKLNINSHKQYYFLYRLSRFILKNLQEESQQPYNYNLISKVTNKFIDLKYIIYKIQPLPSIGYYLQNWLCNQYTMESVDHNIFIEKYTNNTIHNLSELLYFIMYNGLEWYNTIFLDHKDLYMIVNANYSLSICSKNALQQLIYNINLINHALGIKEKNSDFDTSKIYHLKEVFLVSDYLINYCKDDKILLFHSNNNAIVQINNNIYKSFIREIRKILYHQNILDKWRSNSNLNLTKLLKKIKARLSSFYVYYYPLINSKSINVLIILIDNLIYRWIKKNNTKLLVNYKNIRYSYLISN